MKFVIAPDSFKGGLTANEVADAIKSGISKIFPNAEIDAVPMADGGEGTVEALTANTSGKFVSELVVGPLGKKVEATYGLLGDSDTAVIEMSQASGLQFVDEHTADPLKTTTYGTGQLIISALNHGARKIILGLGGSATNDGGAGMAQALGAQLLDKKGESIPYGGGQLDKLVKIDTRNIDPRIAETEILIASDVNNPLVGPNGASAVFGQQKGATSAMIKVLDSNLVHYADVIQNTLGKSLKDYPGAGAAGGIGAGLLAFTNSHLEKGIDVVVKYSSLREKLKNADYVFTGEGSMDFQTQYGKTPFGVALAAKEVSPQAPVIALVGNIGKGIEELYKTGAIDAIFAAPSGSKTLAQAIKDSTKDLSLLSENIARLIVSIKKG